MDRLALLLAITATCGALSGCLRDSDTGGLSESNSSSSGPAVFTGPLRLEEVVSGLDSPLYALVVPDGTQRLAVLQQGGQVVLVENGTVSPTPFLDLGGRTEAGGERGLLGLAFHPQYASNGVAVVSYTDAAGDSVLSRMHLKPDGSGLDTAGEEFLLRVDQPFSNHNGGHVLYGPDAYLYFGLGDGGAAGDPAGHGQNKATLLGSMLRIDVGTDGPYRVPPDNPFIGESGTPPETWSIGWRNPWRFHFDSSTGDLWVADVGQDQFEEINFEPAGAGGRNYGWNLFEGRHHYPSMLDIGAPVPGFTFPVAEYTHAEGCSVTGGPVYRGSTLAGLYGSVLYGDYCSGTIWALAGPDAEPRVVLEGTQVSISSFGLDAEGEILVLDHNGGRLLRIAPLTA